jgi:hypothetical protein
MSLFHLRLCIAERISPRSYIVIEREWVRGSVPIPLILWMDLIQLAIAYRQMEGMVEAVRETWNDVIIMMDLMLNMELSKSKHECVYDL